jgi:hypothetical protein
MTDPRDPEAIVLAWLEAGPTRLPESTRRAIAVTTRTTHQTWRRAVVPWRFPPMNGLSRYALVGAAVVVVAIGGLVLLDVAPPAGVGGPAAGPTPTPTPTDPAVSFDDHPLGELEAGAYVIDALAPLRITFTVPAGWQKNPDPPTGIWTPSSEARLGFFTVDNVVTDPCAERPTMQDPTVGPTVDDLATALQVVPGVDATVTDVTLGGYAGKLVRVMTSPSCGQDSTFLRVNGNTLDKPGPGLGDDARYWILDVDGQRLLIAQVVRPGASDFDRAGLTDIIGSIRIERVVAAP